MKNWSIHVGLAILALFAPAKELFIATGLLVAADMVTGVWAALKTEQPITSSRLRDTVTKFLIYNVAVGSGFLVQKYLMKDAVPVSNIVSSAIGLSELKSIVENLDRITGGNIFKTMLEKLGSVNKKP